MSQHHTGPASLADPFSASTRLAHDHAAVSSSSSLDGESAMLRAVESSVVRKIFGGNDVSRRSFMKMLGASSAMAVINSIFPLDAAKAMALATIKTMEDPELLQKAKEEWKRTTGGKYICPVPPETVPLFD